MARILAEGLNSKLEDVVAQLRSAIPAARAELSRLATVADDETADLHTRGTALERIARNRFYRVARYASFEAFVEGELSISLRTAHRLRRVARELDASKAPATKAAAYASSSRRDADALLDAAITSLRARLEKAGVRGAKVRAVRPRSGRQLVRIEVDAAHVRKIGAR